MRRVITAGLLALPAVFFVSPSAQAQCTTGACAPIAAGITNPFASCKHLGCGGFCFRLFPGLHQEGPLFNYGPYYGYYPFQPYGPWTADLKYVGPTGPDCGGRGCGSCGSCRNGLLSWGKHDSCDDGNCGGWGGYAKATLHNVGKRIHPFGHKCETCGDHAAAQPTVSETILKAGAEVETPTVLTAPARRER
jgi:hypothetical protein